MVSLWDLAAPLVVVEEAGGRFTDLAVRVTAAGGSAVATNGRLHDDAPGVLRPLKQALRRRHTGRAARIWALTAANVEEWLGRN